MLSTAEILAIPEDKRRAATASGPPGVWLEILCLNDVCTQAEGKEGKLATPDLKRFLWRKHVDIERVLAAEGSVEELLAIVKKIHPWSSLHYGLTASDVVRKLYLEWIPKYFGNGIEIQIITPMIRGSLGTLSLNRMILWLLR